ncbi:MAG: site-2 protease family protein [Planctomycetes bacterium]|nr:site-2 protease family protein [Planctomycetota bacterium]MBL7144689.1 site-2 protease family protein [Phycisphaerae bacterium]
MSYFIMFMLISFLILIHELGHFIAAKLSKIPIQIFSVGFGPKLWSFRKGQTEYRISALPIAGYVLPKMEDVDDFFQIDSSRRIAFALGGPLANIILAVICLGFLNALTMGFSFYAVLIFPFVQLTKITSQFLYALPSLFSSPDKLSGVIGIVAMGGQMVAGDFLNILNLAVMLNINLAILNLLPILPLDGGKILFCLLEKIHRSILKLQMPLTVTGWVLFLGLLSYVTVLDMCKYVFKIYA